MSGEIDNIGDISNCIIPPHPYDKPIPVKDFEKYGSFYQEIESFLSYKAEIKDESDFWITLGIQTGFNNCCQLSISQWSNVNDQLKFLKDLNRITHDAINCIERNQLHKKR